MGQAEGLAVQGLTNELQVGPVLEGGGFLWLFSHLFPKIRLTKHKIPPCSHTGLSQPVLPRKDVSVFLPLASSRAWKSVGLTARGEDSGTCLCFSEQVWDVCHVIRLVGGSKWGHGATLHGFHPSENWSRKTLFFTY